MDYRDLFMQITNVIKVLEEKSVNDPDLLEMIKELNEIRKHTNELADKFYYGGD